jgi:hypothetical protein
MRVFHDLEELPPFYNAVLTIGSFDGVHHGHQKIIEQVNGLARSIGGESVLVTFHPHPRLIIYPRDKSLKLLTTIEEKTQLLEQYGLDNVVVVPFTVEFSQQSADEYIQKFLVEKFHPRYIVIGYDHRFGLGRQGDVNYLKWHGQQSGYEVVVIDKQEVEDIAVSSTQIRQVLDNTNIGRANQLLGHPFLLTGTVVHGQSLGRRLGFPTANLEIKQPHKLVPPNGIYAVRVVYRGERYGGMLYIGERPSLKELLDRTIEVNIFDFDKDIYGDKIQLELLQFLREDAAFNGLEALSAQLTEDRRQARQVLRNFPESSPAKKKSADKPEVAIVILNYNGLDYLRQFLPSVLATTYPNYRVIIADNGSQDGSVEFLRRHYPELALISITDNHGFAGGYNRALKEVVSDYYILLNSDVEVSQDWLDPLIELMENDKRVAVCQPKIRAFDEKSRFEYAGAAGGWMDALGYPFCRGRIFAFTEEDRGQYDERQEIFWATGAALCIRSRLYHDIGGFDEDYFAHTEEIDLCWRLKRAGYRIMAEPRSVVYHKGGGTLQYNSPRKIYLNFRNSLFTLVKNEPMRRLFWLIPLRIVLDVLAAGLFLSKGYFSLIGSIARAHLHFYPRLGRLHKRRKEYQELVERVSIHPQPNLAGRYPGSIVWQFYGRGKRAFSDL